MTEEDDSLDLSIPGYVSSKKAARMLGVSYGRLYDLIRAERLPSKKVGRLLMIPTEAVEQFKVKAAGRPLQKPREWHVYRSGIKLLATSIQVKMRPGKDAELNRKLKAINKDEKHLLTGTVQRYILRNETLPGTVDIWLLWKDSELPDKETRRREFDAFKADLADVLDWDTAQYFDEEGLLYT